MILNHIHTYTLTFQLICTVETCIVQDHMTNRNLPIDADLSYIQIFNSAGGQCFNPLIVQGSAVFYNTRFLLTGITELYSFLSFILPCI